MHLKFEKLGNVSKVISIIMFKGGGVFNPCPRIRDTDI